MSARKKLAEMLKVVPQKEKSHMAQLESVPSSPNVSSIEKDSFLQGCHNHGNRMHSTALEEDICPAVEQRGRTQGNEGQQPPQSSTARTSKSPTQTGRGKGQTQGGGKGQTQGGGKGQTQGGGKGQTQGGGKGQTQGGGKGQTQGGGAQLAPSEASAPGRKGKKSLGAKPMDRPAEARGTGATQSAPGENLASCGSLVSQPQEADMPVSFRPTKKRRRPSLSSEDLTDHEDPNWNHGQKRSKTRESSGDMLRTRKSSGKRLSNKKSSGNRKSSSDRQGIEDKKRKASSRSSDSDGVVGKQDQLQRRVKNPSELDVVLDAFLEFASRYRESVASKAVCQAMDAFSLSVQEQLSEKITAAVELNHLRKDTRKVTAAINKKRERLLEAKNEAISKKSDIWGQQREKARLQQRLEDLQKGSALLSGLAHLHSSYLHHAHPAQPHQYGLSSLPALLLETQGILGVEDQLRTINGRLEQALETVT